MTPVADALERLLAALDEFATALGSGRFDRVLAAELPLAAAVASLAMDARAPVGPADRARVRRQATEVRSALARCVALGEASGGLLNAMFGSDLAYERTGKFAGAPRVRGAIESRT